MRGTKEQVKKVIEHSLPWLVLAILLSYTYAKFLQHPYGFWWLPPEGRVAKIFVNQPEPTLKVGDHLVQIGPVRWDDFHADLRKTFFEGVKEGAIVPIVVERGGQLMTIAWKLPGLNWGELSDQLFNEWFLSYFFWLAGGLSMYFLRPRDERWLLLSAFNFLTAIWLITGSGLSAFHIWNSAIVMRMAIWLSVPVYLHLHWAFPRPLGKLPPLLIGIGYGSALLLCAAQWFQLLPRDLYYVGFLLAVVGSVILLHIHFIRQKDVRRDARLVLIAASSALAPCIALAVASILSGTTPQASSLALLSLPLLPFAYLYAAYRRQLGGLEMRANRFLSIYLFLILLGTVGLPLIVLAENLFPFPEGSLIIGVFASLATTCASIWGFPSFQNYVERRILGIPLPSKRLQEICSNHITNSTSLSKLLPVIREQILPSLLVREFVFLQLSDGAAKVLMVYGVGEGQIPNKDEIPGLLATAGRYRPPEHINEGQPSRWVRLALILKIEDKPIGLWLFGRHDPDDLYSQAEIPVLQSLANQTAIAKSRFRQVERLQAIYEADISRHEEERRGLARDLHDSILNELAALRMRLDDTPLPAGFQESYQEVMRRTREIASDLRPPLLDYGGLKLAIEGLADNLMQRSKDTINIVVDIVGEKRRYSSNIELHIFRIVQEACENALRHGQANQITISGRFDPQQIELKIEDNGIGFETEGILEDFLIHKHFGLAGMIERATLLGGEVKFDSAPKAGTRISVIWNSDKIEAA